VVGDLADNSPGRRLRDVRLRLEMTQQQLAAIAGVGVGTVRDFEQGRSSRLRAQSLRALADALGLSARERQQLQQLAQQPEERPVPARGQVRISVLGPLSVTRASEPLPIGAGRHRVVLARLALTPDRVVSREELIHLLWDEHAPPAAVTVVQTHMSRLRRLLEPVSPSGRDQLLVRVAGGYQLRVNEQQLDLTGYRAALNRARATGDPERAYATLFDALDMWRGDHVAEDVPELAGDPLVVRLAEERVEAAIWLSRLGERLNRQPRVLPVLRRLATLHPWHEALHARLIFALAASGQQAAALEAYDAVCRRLAEELGIDAGPELADARRSVLRGQGYRRTPRRVEAAGHPSRPWEAPAYPRDFSGRTAELNRVQSLLRSAAQRSGTGPVAACVISGMAGVGKTSLALRVAGAMRRDFPDGQLYIDLRGADQRPVAGDYALARLLRSLGVQGHAAPTDRDEAAALYRSILSERRMLVLLDNAADGAQVRPLLPGPGDSAALITSRNRCAELDTAAFLNLGILDSAAALDMLAARVGAARVAAERAEAEALVEACGRLPVALRVIASRLAARPERSLGELVERLAGESSRLEQLHIGDVAVTASFELSHRELEPTVGRVFRMAALTPGTTFSVTAVTALLPVRAAEARQALEVLAAENLVQSAADGRYHYHDLLRLYATRRAETQHGSAEVSTATARLLDWYLARTAAAMRLIYAEMVRLPLEIEPEAGAFADVDAARRWLDEEIDGVVAGIATAAGGPHRGRAWQLADQLRGYFFVTRDAVAWLATGHAGLAAAEAAGDLRAQAAMHQTIGQAHWSVGRLKQADEAYRKGVDAARRSGWRIGEAYLLHNLGVVHGNLARTDEAQALYHRVLGLCTSAEYDHVRAVTLNDLAVISSEQGRLAEAADYLRVALAINQGAARLPSAMANRVNLGMVLRQLGEFDAAREHFDTALRHFSGIASRSGRMAVLDELGQLYCQTGGWMAAVRAATEAVELARELEDLRSLAGVLNTLGAALLGAEAVTEARECFTEALRLSDENGFRYFEAQAGIGVAETLLHDGAAQQAYATAHKAHDLAAGRAYRQLVDDGSRVMARAALALGERPQAAQSARAVGNLP
jgi:DNA-binding SARP family transcriptional activator/tetratricopeptide (TPR) repeat protein